MSKLINDNITEAEYNPFDAPISGQSLTDEPGNYPWEHPPKTTDPIEAIEKFWDRLTDPEVAQEMITMMEAGVPIEALARILTFTVEDFTNKKTIRDMLTLKEVNERIEEVAEDIKQEPPKGLMAPKNREEV
jgi:hypothetical protein